MRKPLVYLASPYTSRSVRVMEFRHVASCRAAGELIRLGLAVFSPIAHSHGIALFSGLPQRDRALWVRADRALMEACTECVVLCIDGWRESVGVAGEVAYFIASGRPVRYLSNGRLGKMPPRKESE